MNDFENQAAFVSRSMERMLGQIDLDPLSPHYGCAHLAYWRDKTSDVADMRRQEVMLAMALLYQRDYPGLSWRGDKRLKRAVQALLHFWCTHCYSDGARDEWYKGERGFAVAAFSLHAVARTISIMGDDLSDSTIKTAKTALRQTASWLADRDDLFKTNHQAVAVAALAWAGHILKEDSFRLRAKVKIRSILDQQTEEGWFPEIGHVDVGYLFLTVEFVALALELWNDWDQIAPWRKAFDFACEFVHPDLTVGEEYGTCHNTYLSRLAVVLMAPFSGRAAYLRKRLGQESTGFRGLTPTLTDDLRFPRWSWQPLIAYELWRQASSKPWALPETIPLFDPASGFRLFPGAGLARFSSSGGTGLLVAPAGGLLRFFSCASGRSLSDFGYVVGRPGTYLSNLTFNRGLKIDHDPRFTSVQAPLAAVKKFMPPYWARIILRLASSTAWGAKVIRNMIDWYRNQKGTSINQASANLKSDKSLGLIVRNVQWTEPEVKVIDHLAFSTEVEPTQIFSLTAQGADPVTFDSVAKGDSNLPPRLRNLTITKTYRPDGDWRLHHQEIKP